MKKLATLLLAAGLVFGISTGASAVDFKAKGKWFMNFAFGQNGGFVGQKGMDTGWDRRGSEDEFNAQQRMNITLEAVANENLSGTVAFEIGKQVWGKAANGGALGADGQVVKVKHAYIDWLVPQTDLKVRMGIQPIALPSFTAGSQIFDADVAGVNLNYQFTENVGLTFFWARPYNDNGRYVDKHGNGSRDHFMDNVDLFALALPLAFDGVKATPFVMFGAMGPGSLPKNSDDAYWTFGPGADNDDVYAGGMFPLGGARNRDGSIRDRQMSSYGTAWWAGLALDVTALDPLRFALDFNYGATNWQDNSAWNRKGWMLNGLVEYKLDFMTPGLVAWYASGDDSNPKNGSERMPVVSNDEGDNDFSNFAFSGGPAIYRESMIGTNMTGTWGIGLRLRDISFVEDLKHTFRINYIGGTNSPKMVKRGMGYNTVSNNGYSSALRSKSNIGVEGLYMTTNDSAIEFALQNEYKIYENLKVMFDVSYLATSLGNNRIYRTNGNGGVRRADISDPWNINLQFQYAF